MPVSGDFGQLGKLIRSIDQVASGKARRALVKNLAAEARSLTDETFEQGASPDGVAWAPLEHRAGEPLRDTGRLMSSFTTNVLGADAFKLGTNVFYAPFHQYGTAEIPARPMVPSGTLPDAWEAAFVEVAEDVFAKLFRTAAELPHMPSLQDVYTAVAARLVNVAPSKFGRLAAAENDAVGRYVWVPVTDEPSGPTSQGGNPKVFYDRTASFEVHCWGSTYGDAERMRQALITAMREELGGANFRPGRATWREPKYTETGWVVEQSFQAQITIVEAAIPTVTGTPVADKTLGTVVITSADFDPAGASDPDGVLQAGETPVT